MSMKGRIEAGVPALNRTSHKSTLQRCRPGVAMRAHVLQFDPVLPAAPAIRVGTV